MLTLAELEAMRVTQEAAMTDTATRLVLSETRDDIGGGTPGYGTAGTAIRCRLASVPLSARSGVEGGRFTVHDVATLTVPHDQAIDTSDHWIVNATTYRVLSVDDAGTWVSARRAQVEQVA